MHVGPVREPNNLTSAPTRQAYLDRGRNVAVCGGAITNVAFNLANREEAL